MTFIKTLIEIIVLILLSIFAFFYISIEELYKRFFKRKK